jgi:enterochelin esterase family protein
MDMNFFSYRKSSYWFLIIWILGLPLAYANPLGFALNKRCFAWDHSNPQVPKGQVVSDRFWSRLLKNKRDIWIYIPPYYEWRKGPYPLLVVFDGQAYKSHLIPAPIILDNLIAAGKIPPVVALFISSIDQPTRNRELPCNSLFIECITKELLPWVSRRYFVTQAPSQTIIAGSSYGGLAAVYASLLYPQRFGNVLSQSGAFWWHPTNGEDDWFIKQFEAVSNLPVNFYLDVGDQETERRRGQMSMVEVNRHLHKILKDKGCSVTYNEFIGGHDYECWKKTFAIGLIALFEEQERKTKFQPD